MYFRPENSDLSIAMLVYWRVAKIQLSKIFVFHTQNLTWGSYVPVFSNQKPKICGGMWEELRPQRHPNIGSQCTQEIRPY